MDDLHRELAQIAFTAGEDLGLMLAGGYAIRAHGLTERPSGDVDLATSAMLDLLTIVDRLSDASRVHKGARSCDALALCPGGRDSGWDTPAG